MPPERASKAHRLPQVVSIDRSAGLVWRGPDYPVLSPGKYIVRGVKIQGPEWVRSYRRWSVRVEFGLISEPASVSAFFNLGDDQSGYKVGRQSRFYKAWTLANGEHPRRGEVMSPDIFLEGKFFEVEVESCNRDAEGNPKPGAEVYSTVTRILSANWP